MLCNLAIKSLASPFFLLLRDPPFSLITCSYRSLDSKAFQNKFLIFVLFISLVLHLFIAEGWVVTLPQPQFYYNLLLGFLKEIPRLWGFPTHLGEGLFQGNLSHFLYSLVLDGGSYSLPIFPAKGVGSENHKDCMLDAANLSCTMLYLPYLFLTPPPSPTTALLFTLLLLKFNSSLGANPHHHTFGEMQFLLKQKPK